jgi:GNAT superfamily N-acetyltransferase
MASSEALAVDRLARADVAGGLALSEAAGWNQTADDWAFFIDAGHVVGARDDSGRLVATAAALPYDGDVGWISMVLVDAAHRHAGLATRLLDSCVEVLQRGGRVPVLDATPAGAAVYRQRGFVAGFGFERWEGDGGGTKRRDAACIEGFGEANADADALIALDRSASGVGRAALLRSFLARPTTRRWNMRDASGFALSRAGRRATQLGPVVAADERAAIDLVDAALAAARGRVFIDVPLDRRVLGAWLAERGFVRQRPFVRMALGSPRAAAIDARVCAVAGPEFG